MHYVKLSGRVKLSVCLLVLVVATLGVADVAGANPPSCSGGRYDGHGRLTGSISVDQGSGSAAVGAAASSNQGGCGGNSTGGSGGGSTSCQWQLLATQKGGNAYDPKGEPILGGGGGYDENGLVPAGATGTWYIVTCPGDVPDPFFHGLTGELYFIPGGGPPSPHEMLTQATAQLQLAAPNIQMSPPSTSAPPGLSVSQSKAYWQIVQVPTWVWLLPAQWVPVHATATVPGVTVTATAVPAHIVLTYQNGLGATDTVTCNGPGTPYSDALAYRENPRHAIMATSPDCGWTWHDSSAGSPDEKLQVTAQVVYDLSWTVTGAPGGGPLPPLDSPTSTYRMVVGEIQALNIYP